MASAVVKREPPTYAGLSVVIGLISIALGGGYWYWNYAQKRDRDRIRADRRYVDQLPSTATPDRPPVYPSPQPITTAPSVPPAQSMPVPPPTIAQIKQVQHLLNIINRKRPGEDGFVEEIGTAGPKTFKALQAFQSGHGMVQTGKMDGMTLSMLAKAADEVRIADARGTPPSTPSPGAPTRFQFVLRWQDPTFFTRSIGDGNGHWTVEDSLHFVNEVPGDRAHPPAEQDVVKVLVNHYGPASSVGQAIQNKNYDFGGIAGQVVH